MFGFKIGDKVICRRENVCGEIVKIYKPTACEKQIMVKTIDGRLFHAPISMWEKYDDMWTEKLKKSNKTKNLKGIYDFLSIEQIEEAQREMDKYILEMMKKYDG